MPPPCAVLLSSSPGTKHVIWPLAPAVSLSWKACRVGTRVTSPTNMPSANTAPVPRCGPRPADIAEGWDTLHLAASTSVCPQTPACEVGTPRSLHCWENGGAHGIPVENAHPPCFEKGPFVPRPGHLEKQLSPHAPGPPTCTRLPSLLPGQPGPQWLFLRRLCCWQTE